jgi:hypothetical protein
MEIIFDCVFHVRYLSKAAARYGIIKDAVRKTNSAPLRIALVFATALMPSIIGGGLAVAQPARRLPAVQGYDLSGEARRFPSGLPTELTLVIAAFDRAQQSIADRLFDQIAKRPSVIGRRAA